MITNTLFINAIAVYFLIFWCIECIFHISAIIYGKYKLHRNISSNNQWDEENIVGDLASLSPALPKISILKPLMGTDINLEKNLETFFTMNYPASSIQLIFCVENQTDPCIPIINRLIEKYPFVDSNLFISNDYTPSNVCINPKINNLLIGYENVKYDLIVISDSNLRMNSNTLLCMTQQMTENVGIVHQIPFTNDRMGFVANIEKIYFGAFQARIHLCAELFGFVCYTGMSSLLRKNVLDELGGLSAFGCYLAEDFFIANAFKKNGWKICICSEPANQNAGTYNLKIFSERLIRWIKLRMAMLPILTICFEPFAKCLILGGLTSFSVKILFKWDSLSFYLIHILIWCLFDWFLLQIVQNGSLPFTKYNFVLYWIFCELIGPYCFFLAIVQPVIKWRTREFYLEWGGIARNLIKK